MGKAIIISANPFRYFEGGQPEGSIAAHQAIIRTEGAVIWRLVPPGGGEAGEFPHKDIRRGYIYDVSRKRVTHYFNVLSIKPMYKISYAEASKLVVGGFIDDAFFRSQMHHFYAVKMAKISALPVTRALNRFKKYEDGKHIKLVRNYCIVKYAHLETE